MKRSELNKAVFLDRDGTLIEEVDFLSRVEDMRLFSFTYEAIKLLKNAGYMVVVITNQSGIGRGHFSEDAMHEIHREMNTKLEGMIDAFYFCPHLPDEGCSCRKPGTGMIEAACDDLTIDRNDSWVVGDKVLDVEAGYEAGMRTAMVMTGYGRVQFPQAVRKPGLVADDLLKVTRKILARTDDTQHVNT